MKLMGDLRSSLFLLVALLLLPATSGAQVYSYVDQNGIRVLTNIPPKQDTADVQTRPLFSSRAPQATPAPPPPPPRQQATGSASPAPAVSAPAVLEPIIEKYSKEYRLDPSLVKSIIATESGFNPKAVSRAGARGLMQLMPATASRLGVRNSFDAEDNIRGGTKHLRTLLDTFDNDLPLSLAAYNAGENLVQRIGRIPNFKETHDYVRTVTTRYGRKTHDRTPSVTVDAPVRPLMFRFLDENGVLHLSNTPPSRQASATFPGASPPALPQD
jgi:soluble lytic murein transglycosylase-like protein